MATRESEKCANCPLKGMDKDCNAVLYGNRRLCQLTNPDHPDYNVNYVNNMLDKELEPVSDWQKGINFLKSYYEHWQNGKPVVDNDTWAERQNICMSCEFLIRKGNETYECGLCGCSIVDKSHWADQSCPDEPPRWDKVDHTKAQPSTNVKGCGCS